MGRWGQRLFDHDQLQCWALNTVPQIAQGNPYQAVDIAVRLLESTPEHIQQFWLRRFHKEIEKCTKADLGAENPLLKMPADVLPISLEVYNKVKASSKSSTNNSTCKPLSTSIREKLDAGLGAQLLALHREYDETEPAIPLFPHNAKYCLIGLSAILMTYGAHITAVDLSYLRQLVPILTCTDRYTIPTNDSNFRLPGKKQFLAALDHYQPGTMRSFTQPSCHGCGKVNQDIVPEGKVLKKCGSCLNKYNAAWFCDVNCQRGYWKTHKRSCGASLAHTAIGLYSAHHDDGVEMFSYPGQNV
ncbi:hypothetical protein BD289DRAFT_457177 [Coniella lustricola]|uniref:MYND-type domain-containing protein n=1 Tax=Coniella lustricola TaxID=2025994 RepID=A0A2T2ZSX3_9PEZI|nr:hypothetical protein BD289DRAFT_457177 [Coniella lustricola]